MPSASDARRRLGLIALTISAVMLLGGQTVLEPFLDGLLFMAYWLVCFLFTMGAILIALLDFRALRKQSREIRRKMMRESFGDLPAPPPETQADEKQKNG